MTRKEVELSKNVEQPSDAEVRDQIRGSDLYSPTIKRVMERFWKRCDQLDAETSGVAAMTDIITNADKLACAQRELAMRKRVYERWVDEGKMSAGKAAHEIACMESIVVDYLAFVEKEQLL